MVAEIKIMEIDFGGWVLFLPDTFGFWTPPLIFPTLSVHVYQMGEMVIACCED